MQRQVGCSKWSGFGAVQWGDWNERGGTSEEGVLLRYEDGLASQFLVGGEGDHRRSERVRASGDVVGLESAGDCTREVLSNVMLFIHVLHNPLGDVLNRAATLR